VFFDNYDKYESLLITLLLLHFEMNCRSTCCIVILPQSCLHIGMQNLNLLAEHHIRTLSSKPAYFTIDIDVAVQLEKATLDLLVNLFHGCILEPSTLLLLLLM